MRSFGVVARVEKVHQMRRAADLLLCPRMGQPWSAAEHRRLLALNARYIRLGSQRWSKISTLLGRTTLAVQGRYHLLRAFQCDTSNRRAERRVQRSR